jgi:hypothetical protein
MKTSAAIATLFCTSIAAAGPGDPVEYIPLGENSATAPERQRAPDPEPGRIRAGDRSVAFADVGVRVAPVGAMLTSGIFFRRTFAADESGRFERSYLQGGVALGITPASFQPQAHLEYLPAPFLALRADFAATRYFGETYGLYRFESADADFGDDALSNRKGDGRSVWGFKGGLSLLPRAKFGSLLILSKLSFTGYRYDDPGPYVWEPELDTLLSTSDYVFQSRTDFLFELHRGPGAESFMLGPTVDSMRTIDSALSRTRAGATTWFVPAEQWANLRRPRLYATAGVNIDDPNRSGEPFAMLGIGADME